MSNMDSNVRNKAFRFPPNLTYCRITEAYFCIAVYVILQISEKSIASLKIPAILIEINTIKTNKDMCYS